MGGYGSGRPGSGRRTTGGMWRLDVRWLYREGLLTLGRSSTVSWSRNGQETSSINTIAYEGLVALKYRSRLPSGEWEDKEQLVSLQWTACHLGGRRPWFLCPYCERRVAILWGGSIYACRHCHKLTYSSQRQAAHDRLLNRALQIRERLGWADEWGLKPKGMHQKTFDRLVREYRRFDEASWSALAKTFNIR